MKNKIKRIEIYPPIILGGIWGANVTILEPLFNVIAVEGRTFGELLGNLKDMEEEVNGKC